MSRGTWDTHKVILDFAYKTFTSCGQPFQTVLLSANKSHIWVPQPSRAARVPEEIRVSARISVSDYRKVRIYQNLIYPVYLLSDFS